MEEQQIENIEVQAEQQAPQVDARMEALKEPINTEEEASQVEGAEPTQEEQSEFIIPDAYKEKKWADKIKSEQDLWKQLDNAQSLIGKKQVPLNLAEATQEEREEFYKGMRPETPDAYEFEEGSQFKEEFANIFYENGIALEQQKSIMEGYKAFENKVLEQLADPQDFKERMVGIFGDEAGQKVPEYKLQIEKTLGEDGAQVFNSLPNQTQELIYRLAKSYNDNYGVKNIGGEAHLASRSAGYASTEERMKDLRAQIMSGKLSKIDEEEKRAELVNLSKQRNK